MILLFDSREQWDKQSGLLQVQFAGLMQLHCLKTHKGTGVEREDLDMLHSLGISGGLVVLRVIRNSI